MAVKKHSLNAGSHPFSLLATSWTSYPSEWIIAAVLWFFCVQITR